MYFHGNLQFFALKRNLIKKWCHFYHETSHFFPSVQNHSSETWAWKNLQALEGQIQSTDSVPFMSLGSGLTYKYTSLCGCNPSMFSSWQMWSRSQETDSNHALSWNNQRGLKRLQWCLSSSEDRSGFGRHRAMGCAVSQLLEELGLLGKALSWQCGQRGGASCAGFPALLGSGHQASTDMGCSILHSGPPKVTFPNLQHTCPRNLV